MNNNQKLLDLITQTQLSLKYIKYIGFETINFSKFSLELINNWDNDRINVNKTKPIKLDNLRINIKNCKQCKLYRQRSNIVFGEGNENASLIFVGEGPGYEEDKTGRPFVGKAGRLLTRIIEAMGLDRNDVYICNIVKCRPPENRNPDHQEIKKCMPFLMQQIETIRPDFICTLGAVATKSLLDIDQPISKLRGNFTYIPKMKYIKVMPTYHPAYLLRNPNKKREVWKDIKKIMGAMGQPSINKL